MNRRKFLKSGGLAVAVVAGLPAAARSFRQDPVFVTYRSKPEPGKEGQTLYELNIYHNGFDNFSSASADQKLITLKIGYFATSDLSKPTSEGEFQYVIKEVTVKGDTTPLWTISTKLDKKVSGEYKLEKSFPKNPKMRCSKFEYIEILAKDGSSLISLPYPPPASSGNSGSSGSGCFLTTACVEHQQLADDCMELQTLRKLRDQFMLSNEEGRKLIQQYIIAGPAIVNAINGCDNRSEIYDYMYSKMIMPSVKMVQEGKYETAVEYYSAFVKALMKKYN
ncbi:MAG: twin-arginine translocation signal domain-containing protein [Ferruginibacter sp.]